MYSELIEKNLGHKPSANICPVDFQNMDKTVLQNLFFSVEHTVKKESHTIFIFRWTSRFREDKEMQILMENIQFCFMSIDVFCLNDIFYPFLTASVSVVCLFVDTSLNCSSERWNPPKPLNQCLHRNSAEAAQKSLWQSSPEILISPPSPPVFPRSTQLSHRRRHKPFSWDRY